MAAGQGLGCFINWAPIESQISPLIFIFCTLDTPSRSRHRRLGAESALPRLAGPLDRGKRRLPNGVIGGMERQWKTAPCKERQGRTGHDATRLANVAGPPPFLMSPPHIHRAEGKQEPPMYPCPAGRLECLGPRKRNVCVHCTEEAGTLLSPFRPTASRDDLFAPIATQSRSELPSFPRRPPQSSKKTRAEVGPKHPSHQRPSFEPSLRPVVLEVSHQPRNP